MFDPKTGKALEIALDFPDGLPPKPEFEPASGGHPTEDRY